MLVLRSAIVLGMVPYTHHFIGVVINRPCRIMLVVIVEAVLRYVHRNVLSHTLLLQHRLDLLIELLKRTFVLNDDIRLT